LPDAYPPTRQREALLKLVSALGCRDNALKRDECSDWAVFGKLGHIHAIPGALNRPGAEGFELYCRCTLEFEEPAPGSQKWANCKKAMAFCEVTQDGDFEGMLFLSRLPTFEEATIIRDKLGLPKKREVSEEEAERLRAMGYKRASGASESPSGDEPRGE
jgi:hypothetical protein